MTRCRLCETCSEQCKPKEFKTSIAKAVFEARGDMSQRKFADAIGVAQATVAQYETGIRRPSPVTAKRISEMTGQPIEKYLIAEGEI